MKLSSIFLLIACVSFVACFDSHPDDTDNWTRTLYRVETSSSPRAIDLNRDGIPDIVLGAGGEEFDSTDAAVVALNGANGEMLWKVKGRNQMVGCAIFKDITGDSVPDVFIGGRSAQFFAIDGLTGRRLWEYVKADNTVENFMNDTSMLNFFNPQFIPDQNGDGVEDMLTAFGGFVPAQGNDPNRPSGMLIVIDPMTGKALKKAFVPGGKETYMSPVLYDFGKGLTIIFGTGGETLQGNLYAVPLAEFMVSGTAKSIRIDSAANKGFIAPPIITDLTGDGIADIVIGSMDGWMKTFNGKDFSLIWSKKIEPAAETQSMPAPVYFNDDTVPDFFNTFNVGQWPNNDTAIHIILSGVDGHELFRDTLGMLQYSSPVLFDHDEDSYPDLVYPVNRKIDAQPMPKFKTQLMLYNGKTGAKSPLDSLYAGRVFGSTPLITDLDSDGKVDLIYTYMAQGNEMLAYNYLIIKRRELNVKMTKNIWGGYMGTDYKSIFKGK
jgi:outer membrane protein assembly factor BamB